MSVLIFNYIFIWDNSISKSNWLLLDDLVSAKGYNDIWKLKNLYSKKVLDFLERVELNYRKNW